MRLRLFGRRDDRGATAVVVGIMAVLLFSLGALVVDMGNAFVRKRDVQAQADASALAGAAELPSSLVNDPLIAQAVSEYLNANRPQDDRDPALPDVVAVDLQDGDQANGEICFGQWVPSNGSYTCSNPSTSRLSVLTPAAHVSFGLAGIMGFSGTDVQAKATVGVGTPLGYGMMPVYAAPGCDLGTQTITDPAQGQVVSVPPLPNPDDENEATLGVLTARDEGGVAQSPGNSVPLTPTAVDPDTPYSLEITGTKFAQTTVVGFFRETGSPVPPANPVFTSDIAVNVNNNSILVNNIPADVLRNQGVYWVRVWKSDNPSKPAEAQWSKVSKALPLRVGSATLECAATTSVEGNFGTLSLPRKDASKSTGSGWLPINMAKGLHCPDPSSATNCLSLSLYPPGGPSVPINCQALNTPPAPIWSDTSSQTNATLLKNTNCVDTDTGLPANSTTAGLITGPDSSTLGRLNHDTTSSNGKACGADGTANRWPTGIVGFDEGGVKKEIAINNDVLSCFFTDDTVKISDVTKCDPEYDDPCTDPYTGGVVFSQDIYDSPRFMWVPVLAAHPGNGASLHWSIVNFRPAFLTDQLPDSTRANPLVGTGTSNGLVVKNGSLVTVKVTFFNPAALPDETRGPLGDYIGVGPIVSRLID